MSEKATTTCGREIVDEVATHGEMLDLIYYHEKSCRKCQLILAKKAIRIALEAVTAGYANFNDGGRNAWIDFIEAAGKVQP